MQEVEQVQRLCAFLAQHSWLAGCHTNTFFTQRLWESVPSAWLRALAAASPSELSAVPSGYSCADWPSDLREFIREAREFSLQPTVQSGVEQPLAPQCQCQAQLDRVLYEGMSAKKRHEVDQLASLIAEVSKRASADAIVDVGAGQGHLSRVLAFRYGLRTISVEAVASLTAAASERAQKLCRMKRCSTCGPMQLPLCVTAAAWTPQELLFAVNQALGAATRHRILFACLHACGDLTPNVLRTFVECGDAVAVVAVGCCYNLVSEAGNPEGGERAAASRILAHTAHAGGELAVAQPERAPVQASDASLPGYPMSAPLAHHTLGRQARMLACQSAERWRDAEETRSWRGLAFRASLEVVLLSCPGVDASALRGGGAACDAATSFNSYIHESFARVGVECPLGDHELEALWRDELEEPAAYMGPFCTLRCVLAAPTEALLVLDRVLYLREQIEEDHSVFWKNVFDAHISPRNVAIVALTSALN